MRKREEVQEVLPGGQQSTALTPKDVGRPQRRMTSPVIIGVATRCVLDDSLASQRECSSFDAIDTFKRAVTSAKCSSKDVLPGEEHKHKTRGR